MSLLIFLGDKPMQEQMMDLEVRFAFQEDLLNALNKRVAEQDKQINELSSQIQFMYQKMKSLLENADDQESSSLNEVPPHY